MPIYKGKPDYPQDRIDDQTLGSQAREYARFRRQEAWQPIAEGFGAQFPQTRGISPAEEAKARQAYIELSENLDKAEADLLAALQAAKDNQGKVSQQTLMDLVRAAATVDAAQMAGNASVETSRVGHQIQGYLQQAGQSNEQITAIHRKFDPSPDVSAKLGALGKFVLVGSGQVDPNQRIQFLTQVQSDLTGLSDQDRAKYLFQLENERVVGADGVPVALDVNEMLRQAGSQSGSPQFAALTRFANIADSELVESNLALSQAEQEQAEAMRTALGIRGGVGKGPLFRALDINLQEAMSPDPKVRAAAAEKVGGLLAGFGLGPEGGGGQVTAEDVAKSPMGQALAGSRDEIERGLQRLAWANDPESVQTRKMIQASPAFRQWKKDNDYEGLNDDSAFGILVTKKVSEGRFQDRVAKAVNDVDVLTGVQPEGIGRQLGAARRTFGLLLRPRVAAEVKRIREGGSEERTDARPGAKATAGAAGPADRAPTTTEEKAGETINQESKMSTTEPTVPPTKAEVTGTFTPKAGVPRVIKGEGGWTYRQYPDGRLEVIGGPPGKSKATPENPIPVSRFSEMGKAILGEFEAKGIGRYAGEPPAEGESEEPIDKAARVGAASMKPKRIPAPRPTPAPTTNAPDTPEEKNAQARVQASMAERGPIQESSEEEPIESEGEPDRSYVIARGNVGEADTPGRRAVAASANARHQGAPALPPPPAPVEPPEPGSTYEGAGFVGPGEGAAGMQDWEESRKRRREQLMASLGGLRGSLASPSVREQIGK